MGWGWVEDKVDDAADHSSSSDGVGGSVTRAGDTADLDTPAKVHDRLRLDYPGTVYSPADDAVTAIRFNTQSEFEVPRSSDFGGGGRYDGFDEPFTGNGFTKTPDGVVPEWQPSGGGAVRVELGAEMWSIRRDGTQTLDAVFDGDQWVKVP